MKIEFEVKAFGEVEVQGTEDAYKAVEVVRVNQLSKETTLGEIEALLSKLFEEVEKDYNNPKQLLGKITIRAKRDNGEIGYLG